MEITAYFSPDLPPPHNATERYVRDLLTEYRDASKGKIGAALATCIQNPNWYLVWIGSGQIATFGPTIAGLIHKHLHPGRVTIWDTKERGGRPDTAKMVSEICKIWEAECVIVTSNLKGSTEIMESLIGEGIPCFGTLFDFCECTATASYEPTLTALQERFTTPLTLPTLPRARGMASATKALARTPLVISSHLLTDRTTHTHPHHTIGLAVPKQRLRQPPLIYYITSLVIRRRYASEELVIPPRYWLPRVSG